MTKSEAQLEHEITTLFIEKLKNAGVVVDNFLSKEDALKHIKDNFLNPLDLLENRPDISNKNSILSEELENIDTAVLEGQFGVANNGVVWIDGKNLFSHFVPFIVSHLVLVLDRNKIVNNMHEAYERIAQSKTNFGVFVSGPSKTEDIEQNLVYGTHGATKIFLFIIGRY